MKFTNKFGLPLPVVMAAEANSYDKHGDYSMTELIKPPQMATLMQRYGDKLEADVASQAYSMESTALHALLAEAKVPGGVPEMRFMVDVLNQKISMKPDFLYPLADGTYHLLDNKRVSWMAVKQGPKDEWITQLNGYAYGLRKLGYKISRISVIAWYRDWSYMECHVKKLANYPPCEIQELVIPIWPDDKCLAYLEDRVKHHAEAKMKPDAELPQCSNEDRWADPDCFAVVYASGKSMTKAVSGGAYFLSLTEAQAFNSQREKDRDKAKSVAGKIVYRRSESKRCERGYCPASPFCQQYQKMIKDRDPF